MKRAARFLGYGIFFTLLAVLSPLLFLAVVLYLAISFAAILGGLGRLGAGIAWLRFQIWRITQ